MFLVSCMYMQHNPGSIWSKQVPTTVKCLATTDQVNGAAHTSMKLSGTSCEVEQMQYDSV